MPKHAFRAILCILVLAGALPGCRRPTAGSARQPAGALRVERDPAHPGRFFARIDTMGTEGTLMVLLPDGGASEERAAGMLEAAVAPVNRVMRTMNTYDPDSEVSRLNRLGAGEAVELSPDTMRVLKESVRFSRLSGGAFDVTYAPLRTLWRAAQRDDRLPTEEEIRKAQEAIGADKLELSDHAARFSRPAMEVDLGGIAKGYGIDLAAEALLAAGCTSGLVEIGGDLRLIGHREGGEKWKVQTRDPRPGVHEPMYLRLADAAVATSGDYARYFTVQGRRLSHIVDPRTGRPVSDMPSVTVVAPDATTADALATAISVLGPKEGVELIDRCPGVECMIMYRVPTEAGEEVRVVFSRGFRELMEGAAP